MKQSTVYIVHASEDQLLFAELAEFLESGAGVRVFREDGCIGPGETVVSKAAEGLSADILLILLSPASSPKPWLRAEWEPVFEKEAVELGVQVGTALLADCEFPKLLRRNNFFDPRHDPLSGLRRIKSWIRGLQSRPNPHCFQPAPGIVRPEQTEQIESLRRQVGDRPGVAANVETALALEFARQCEADFDDVFWLFCGDRSFAQIAGDVGSQIGLNLPGQAAGNAQEVRRVLGERRCLLILAEADEGRIADLIPGGQCSAVLTKDIAADQTPLPDEARELLEAMCACAPGGFRLDFAAQVAQIPAERAGVLAADLINRGLLLQLDDIRLYLPHPIRARCEASERRDRHAALAAKTSQLAELLTALEWTLSDHGAWPDACTAAWNAFSILDVTGRHAEAFELLGALARLAGVLGDRGTLDRCLRQQAWILETWGRDAEAAQLARERQSLTADQMLLPF